MGLMRVLDSTGDSVVSWDVTDADTLLRAEDLFQQLRQEGKIPFARQPGTKSQLPEQIANFDAAVEEIIWVRPIQGG